MPRFFGPFLLFFLALASQAQALTSAPVDTPRVSARLITEFNAAAPGDAIRVGLHFEIIDHWHLYWRNPGDSGEPPKLSWRLPDGFTAGEIDWPIPKRLPIGPLMNFGYEHQLLLPVELSIPDDLSPGQQVMIALAAEWLVCREECIPESGEFRLALPIGETSSSDPTWGAEFAQSRSRAASPSPWQASWQINGDNLELRLADVDLPTGSLQDLFFLPDDYGWLEHAEPQTWSFEDKTLRVRLVPGITPPEPDQPLTGLLKLVEHANGEARTLGLRIAASQAAAPITEPSPATNGLALMLLFALLGGLILNLMPCVFPVLSLKALQLVQQAARSPGQVRWHGLIFTGGVLASFMLLAGLLMALRAGGAQIGWGFQLQEPLFVLLLIWLMFALGLMLSGQFELGGGWMGLGDQLTRGDGPAAAFFTGVLAVIVATPCTVPFMGSALGFAMTRSALEAFSIFLALGLGMALPWLLLAWWPGVGRFLPRPGPWMETFKQILAFPLYATAIWLLWVLVRQMGANAVPIALGGVLSLGMAVWLWPRLRQHRPANILLIALLTVVLTGLATQAETKPQVADANQTWQAWSPERLAQLRAEDRPVLVNFTAAWCISCLVNEKVALATETVQSALRAKGVAYLKGDWTDRNDQIAEVLARHQRGGVPLYLLYPRDGLAEPLTLPQLLTEELVLDYLDRL